MALASFSSGDDNLSSTNLFGQSMVRVLEIWAKHCIDLIENPKPSEPYLRDNVTSRRDKYLRNAFASMDKSSQQAVTELVCKAISGVMFSTLVNFDQYAHGELKLIHVPTNEEELPIEITRKDGELHDELVCWVDSYSTMKTLFIEEVDYKGHKSIRFR